MRQLSYGEKLVGKAFNPSGSSDVDEIKGLYADVIDMLTERHTTSATTNAKIQNRMLEIAAEKAIEAHMWAVKALTYGRN